MEPIPVISQLVPAVIQRTAPTAEEVPGAVQLFPAVFLIGTLEHFIVLLRIQVIKIISVFLKSAETMSVRGIQQIPFTVKDQPAGSRIRCVIAVLADRAVHDVVSLVLNGDPAFLCIHLSVLVEVTGLSVNISETILHDRSVCTFCTRLSPLLGGTVHMCHTVLIRVRLCASEKISGIRRCQVGLAAFCKQSGLRSASLCVIEDPVIIAFRIFHLIPARLIDSFPCSLTLRSFSRGLSGWRRTFFRRFGCRRIFSGWYRQCPIFF